MGDVSGRSVVGAVGAALVLALALTAFLAGASPVGAQSSEGPRPDDFYAEALAANGLAIVERQDEDLSGDGVAETVLLAAAAGCTACPASRLFVFSGSLPVADLDALDEPRIAISAGGPVRITQPVRLPDEPPDSPSGTYTLTLRYGPVGTEPSRADATGRYVLSPDVELSTGPGLPPGKAPRRAVAVYYTLLNAERYEQAYDLLAESFRQAAPYESWAREARSRGVRSLLDVSHVPQTSGRVRVRIEEADRATGQVVRRYEGVWQTVPVDEAGEQWRLSLFDLEP